MYEIEPWLLARILPYHQLSTSHDQWKTAKKNALQPFNELKNFRNRIAHHEPLWKFPAIKDTSNPPKIIMTASKNLDDTLLHFKRKLDILDDAMKAINQSFQNQMMQSNWRQQINYLLSERGIERYKNFHHCPDLTQILPLKEFEKSFEKIVEENKIRQIGTLNTKGLFIPE